jgi:hypothetical protein
MPLLSGMLLAIMKPVWSCSSFLIFTSCHNGGIGTVLEERSAGKESHIRCSYNTEGREAGREREGGREGGREREREREGVGVTGRVGAHQHVVVNLHTSI